MRCEKDNNESKNFPLNRYESKYNDRTLTVLNSGVLTLFALYTMKPLRSANLYFEMSLQL